MAKIKGKTFSATKAVKENARERIGSPPPGLIIPDRKEKAEHGPAKHKRSLEEIVERSKEVADEQG